ncbi:hypothetical protein GWA97_10215 [Flavobacterium sp. LaA7.5]|nr:hypothetical protein [Flavobacterium salilacus subsp. altitudinum]
MKDNLLELVWHELGHCIMCMVTEKSVDEIVFRYNKFTSKEILDHWTGHVSYSPAYNYEYCSKIENIEELSSTILILLSGVAFQGYFKNMIENGNLNLIMIFRGQSTGDKDRDMSDYGSIKKCVESYNKQNDSKLSYYEIENFINLIFERIEKFLHNNFKQICEEVKVKVDSNLNKGSIKTCLVGEDLEGIIKQIKQLIDSDFKDVFLKLKEEIKLKIIDSTPSGV